MIVAFPGYLYLYFKLKHARGKVIRQQTDIFLIKEDLTLHAVFAQYTNFAQRTKSQGSSDNKYKI